MIEDTGEKISDPQIGRVLLDQYRIDELLGQGGMGAVYRGVQLSVDRPVAIKLIAGAVAKNPEGIKRFRREAEATAKLSHPNTVRLFDFGVTREGELFMVMELLDGTDLSKHLKQEGPLKPALALAIAHEILEALGEAHALGIIHRDLKSANIFLSHLRGGRVFAKVMDFGVASIAEDSSVTKLTMTGMVVGTPAYMSPEQARGDPVDGRSDLYSLGILLFEMLTGRHPFTVDSAVSMLLAHVTTMPPSLHNVREELFALDKGVQEFVDHLLAKQPEERPASAEAAIALLNDLISRTAQDKLRIVSGSAVASQSNPVDAPSLSAVSRLLAESMGRALASVSHLIHNSALWISTLATLFILLGLWALWPDKKAPQVPAVPPMATSIGETTLALPKPQNPPSPSQSSESNSASLTVKKSVKKPAKGSSEPKNSESIPSLPRSTESNKESESESKREIDSEIDFALPAEDINGKEPTEESSDPEGHRRLKRIPRSDFFARETPSSKTEEAPASSPPPTPKSKVDETTERSISPPNMTPPVQSNDTMYSNVKEAKRAYQEGKLDKKSYENHLRLLRKKLKQRINTEKLNYRKGLISRREYYRRVRQAEADYEGR